MTELNPSVLMDVIEKKRFGVEYQPIVDITTGDVFAYEALARFYNGDAKALRPDLFFSALHESPLSLFQVELQLKRLQIEGAPNDLPLFLNVDPDAFAVYGDSDANPLLRIFKQRPNLVAEIIENSNINDARLSQDMVRAFRRNGVQFALDDIGAEMSLLSVEVLAEVNFLKLDIEWIRRADNEIYRSLLKSIVTFGRETGKKLVLEGVENDQDMCFASAIGIN